MESKTWTTVDKSTWGDGPWMAEPDKIQFADEATGLPCLIKRSHLSGSLCGYVGVAEGHPWFGQGYGDVDADVHGGLTFADFCQEGDEAHTICHIPGPGEPDRVWWLGFDAGHAFDISPAMEARELAQGYPPIRSMGADWGMGETYKTVAYVKAECASLAEQAWAARVTRTAVEGIDAMTAARGSGNAK